MVPLERAEIYPRLLERPFSFMFMAAVEATFGTAGCCSSTSPYPTALLNMMAGAHNHAQH